MSAKTSMPVGMKPRKRVCKFVCKKEFTLAEVPNDCNLHLGCSGIYHLYVNGKYLGEGPCRSYPENAEYDSYELNSYLNVGKNEIVVDILHHNAPSFHRIVTNPYFWADGAIGELSLSTPEEWVGAQDLAVSDEVPNFSFTIGPVLFRDDRVGLSSWQALEAVKEYTPTVARTLPQLTEKEILVKSQEIYKVKSCSKLYSKILFDHRVTFSQEYDLTPPPESQISSWFYSEIEQEVVCGCWWAEIFVNDVQQASYYVQERSYVKLPLKAGWNKFDAYGGYSQGKWEFALEVPNSAKIVVNAEKQLEDTGSFLVVTDYFTQPEIALLLDKANSPLIRSHWTKIEDEPTDIITPNCDSIVKLDLGLHSLGRIFVELDAPEGTIINIGISEDLRDGRVSYRKNNHVYNVEQVITSSATSRIELFQRRGFRYIELFIQNHTAEVKIHKAGVMENIYPYSYKGSFSCSDDDFNRLWQYGVRTLALCSEDILTDCPWRERSLYGGDMLSEMATMLTVDSDMRLMKRCINLLMESFYTKTSWMQSVSPMIRSRAPHYFEYPMLTIVALNWYVNLTKDYAFFEKWQLEIHKMLEQFLMTKQSNGLYLPTHPAFITHGYTLKNVAGLAFNACGVGFLDASSELFKDSSIADKARELELAIKENLYDAEHDIYFDAPNRVNAVCATGNSWLGCFSSMANSSRDSMVKMIKGMVDKFWNIGEQESTTTSPYGMFYLLCAYYNLDAPKEAEEAMRIVYRDMLLKPTGTIWEHSHTRKSVCHAWSTAPNYYLTTGTLGVRLDCFDRVLIAPQADSVTWAKGLVPHQWGDIEVSWAIDGDTLTVEYKAPEGLKVEVAPKGKLANYTLKVIGK